MAKIAKKGSKIQIEREGYIKSSKVKKLTQKEALEMIRREYPTPLEKNAEIAAFLDELGLSEPEDEE